MNPILRLLFCCLIFPITARAVDAPLNLLFLGDQQAHKPLTRFELLQPVLAKKNIAITYTEDVSSLNLETLNQYDGLVLYANIDSIAPAQAKALLDYVASGKGFVPVHCATYCFRNNEDVVALMGAQFKRHGRGEMTTQPAGIQHPITNGYETFTSWDETYVHHKHNDKDRIVLEYRAGDVQADGNTREPWTWIRSHGKGRVFYTAWGHDERTWNQPQFHDLVERGIRWACGAGGAGLVSSPATANNQRTSLGKQTQLPTDLKPFEYVDVGPEIPNYAAGRGKTLNLMQQPAPAEESMKHMVTPEGFHVELFADESMEDGEGELGDGGKMFEGKPIAMNWDDQGRLWVCETLDYPNELKAAGTGRDRIRIIEDTDKDGRADKSFVFAEDLSIPTAIAFHRGGAVVQNGVETLYLKDTNGDGKADVRKVLISNWTLGDTHGGVSNFRNGLDNWIWGMQGYNASSPVINGAPSNATEGTAQPSFRMGFFRFKLSQNDDPKVEKLEFIRSTTNNTWGLGISEEGLIFGSTANRQPSFFMPIANRYYERVKGWAPETLSMISPTHLFDPITDKVRQVDHHGGYTAAAGHALYTARNYPQSWWNRTAFVCGPTGKLVGTFVIERDGASMKSETPINLLASDDEWTAPIMAEVGPDGNVWVLDWYNYIVQHNPTPQGFKTGKGRAYESKLRDKKHGRIYRIVPDKTAPDKTAPDNPNSGKGSAIAAVETRADSTPAELVSALKNPTMQVRLHAQRLLVERGASDVVAGLLELVADQTVDEIGLNAGSIHALQTLQGLGELDADSGQVFDAVTTALSHPSAGVRLNAIRVLPETQRTFKAIEESNLLADKDAQVVLASLLKVSDTPGIPAGPALSQAITNPIISGDRWLVDAMTSAGAMHAEDFLASTLANDQSLAESATGVISRVAEHFARTEPTSDSLAKLIAVMASSKPQAIDPIIAGMSRGWPKEYLISLDASQNEGLRKVFAKVSDSSKASLARLATSWDNDALEREIAPIVAALVATVGDAKLPVAQRLAAASELMTLDPVRQESANAIQDAIGPQSPVKLSVGLVQTLSQSKANGLANRFLKINEAATPEIRSVVVRVMLSRPELTNALLSAMESGDVQISDLSIQQRDILRSSPSIAIRRRARDVFNKGGVVVNNDRTKLVAAKMPLMQQTGNPELGKAIFTKHCATCHMFKGEGNNVGPNLNGMSVHPKAELLTHILDPNRSVEANYRLYSVLTIDGVVISGLLSGESLTTLEMVDAQGKRHTILREDIEELRPSKNSAMPEGFEQSIDDTGFINLLEYLTQSERFVPLGLESVSTATSTQGMFYDRDNPGERLTLDRYGVRTAHDVPFTLIDPTGGTKKNVVMLHGPVGPFAPKMPKRVSVRCKTGAAKIHMLGGVAGWASRNTRQGGISMIVRLRYSDGQVEEHPLVDGQHFADYNGKFNVPKSKLAIETQNGGQIRQLTIIPKRNTVIETIELEKPDHRSAPLVFAITVERSDTHAEH